MAEKDDMKEKNENEETPEEASSTEEEEDVSDAPEDEAADDTSSGDEAEEASSEDEASDDEDAEEQSKSDEDESEDEADAEDPDADPDADAEATRAPADEEDSEESDDASADEDGSDEDDDASADEDDDSDEDEPASADEDDDSDEDEPASADEDDDSDEDGPVRGYAAFYEHPDHLLAAARHARDSKYEDFDAYSPFPIHGMDEAMGLGRSWIPWVTFGAGIVGFLTANALQFGMMTFDWPMIIGGKPYAPWPSFVPVMFELTVLVAGVTTAIVMLKAAGCFQKANVIDERITNDRFVLWISADDKEFEDGEVESFLSGLNPLEIKRVHQ
ncbi:MAG: DUF3341 domain-containing protein [Myxococcota bacterium]